MKKRKPAPVIRKPAAAVPPPPPGETATERRDMHIPYFGDVLRPQDDVLIRQGGGRGLKIYEDLMRDPHVAAVMDKRVRALIARDWVVEPGGDTPADLAVAEMTESWLASIGFDDVCRHLLATSLLCGFSVSEAVWDVPGGVPAPVAVKPKRSRRFVFAHDWRLRLLTVGSPLTGEEVLERKFIVHRFGSGVDPYGEGLGARLFWPVFFKRAGIEFWMHFAEKFGSPTAIGEYSDGTDSDKLLMDLAGISQDSAIVVPQGTTVKFLEASRSGSVDTYEKLLRYMDEQISEAVLGETLTTNVGKIGSLGAGQVHNEVREETTDGDADALSDTLNKQILTWLQEVRYPGAAPARVWRKRAAKREDDAAADKAEAEAREKAIDYVTKMRTAGYEPEDTAADFETQAKGKWFFAGKPTITRAVTAPAVAFAQADKADHPLLDQVDAAAAPLIEDMIAAIRKELDLSVSKGETPAQFAARLAALESRFPLADLAAFDRDVTTLAYLDGMYNHNG